MEKLQAYLSHIKSLQPVLLDEAQVVLRAYYAQQRRHDSRNEARTTIRMLESLIRLSQGHAKLMYREQVTMQDALMAIMAVENSMLGSALLPTRPSSVFPQDPDAECTFFLVNAAC